MENIVLTPYQVAAGAIYADLDAGRIGSTEARRRLVAAGDTPYDAWEWIWRHHGGARFQIEDEAGVWHYRSLTGPTVEEVDRRMAT